MNNLYITSAVVIALVPLFICLSFRVVFYRRKNKISLSTTKDSQILSRVRAHGNFTEYTPLFVLICLLCELQGANPLANGIFASLFVLGRYSHAIALSMKIPALRPPGMLLSFMPITFSTVLLISTFLK